jgi:predicted transcriptional regulator
MRSKRSTTRVSAGELEMLEMLWRERSVTILEAQQALGLAIGYTTVQTRLNRLVAKRLAARSRQRPARYSAAVTPDDVGRGHLDLLVQRVSQGRVAPLVAHLLERQAISAEEIAKLKQLIADAEAKARQTRTPEQRQP